MSTSPWLDSLAGERQRIGRASTAGRVADVLRDRVTEGHLVPGTRLSEEEVGEALGVSRNTLREAFRLLIHERLLEHVFNRGVFVRSLSRDDVRDIYRVRRLVECAAVRYAGGLAAAGDLAQDALTLPLAALHAAVTEGERARAAGDWAGIGTANMHFHQALASLAGSPRIDETMRQLLAELRLVFHVMADPRAFHEPYLAGNRELCELIEAGRWEDAEIALAAYFDRAEMQLLAAMVR